MVMKAERVQGQIDDERSNWRKTAGGKALSRTYKQPTFRAAIAFVAFVAELAEAADHHPDIDIRYSKVTLTLSTHSAGKITEKDHALIAQIDGNA